MHLILITLMIIIIIHFVKTEYNTIYLNNKSRIKKNHTDNNLVCLFVIMRIMLYLKLLLLLLLLLLVI